MTARESAEKLIAGCDQEGAAVGFALLDIADAVRSLAPPSPTVLIERRLCDPPRTADEVRSELADRIVERLLGPGNHPLASQLADIVREEAGRDV